MADGQTECNGTIVDAKGDLSKHLDIKAKPLEIEDVDADIGISEDHYENRNKSEENDEDGWSVRRCLRHRWGRLQPGNAPVSFGRYTAAVKTSV